MATTLTTLGADDVDAEIEALLDVLWVTDHVHLDKLAWHMEKFVSWRTYVKDAVLVELLNNGAGRNTDSADEELGARVDDDVDELVKLALCVVIAASR